MLVTTRNEHENYPTIKIGPIEDMDAVKELFISCWRKQPNEEESLLIDKILNLVGCHTITVELIAHSWLMLDEDTDILSMHPVIADVVRAQLSPTAANCSTYIKGIVHEIGNLWFKTQEERTSLWPYLASVLNRYPTPLPELIQEYISLSNNSWIVGRCAYTNGNYEQSTFYLEESLRLFTEKVPTPHTEGDTLTELERLYIAKEALADLFFLKQEHKMAEQLYTELMLQMEQDFGFCNPMVCKLKEKIRNRYPHADF